MNIVKRTAQMKGSRAHGSNNDWWSYPLGIFVISRLIVFSASFLALKLFYKGEAMPWRSMPENLWIDGLVRWDSGWYAAIVTAGYTYNPNAESSVAFFPLYPTLVRGLDAVLGSHVIAGVVLSNLCFLVALMVIYRWATFVNLDEDSSKRVIWYLAVSPMAFFFSAYYTESLFLLLVASSVYLGGVKRWFWAAVMAALASSTKVVGVVMWGVLGLMWMEAYGWRWKDIGSKENWNILGESLRQHWKSFMTLHIAPAGLIAYMGFLYMRFDSPLVFVQTQQHWGRAGGGVWSAFMGGFSALRGRDWVSSAGDWAVGNPVHMLWDFAAGLIVILALPLIFRRFGPAIGMLSLLVLLIPLSSGTFASMGRYTLVLFPLFALFAECGSRPVVDRAVSGVSMLLLVTCTMMFALWQTVI